MIRISKLLVLCLLFSACGTRSILFRKGKKSKNNYDSVRLAEAPSATERIITYGDVIDVQVITNNIDVQNKFLTFARENRNLTGVDGSIVSELGYIFLPIVGRLKVDGLKIVDVTAMIKDSLSFTLTKFDLSVQMSGFRVTVLGMVGVQGPVAVKGTQATIIDAISMAGGLSEKAKTFDIKVVRNKGNKKEILFVDLNSIDAFTAEGYYLKSNDVVYVEKRKQIALRENLDYFSFLGTLVNILFIMTQIQR